MRIKLSEKYQHTQIEYICNKLINILSLREYSSFLLCNLDNE
jgi:hypothetical protein